MTNLNALVAGEHVADLRRAAQPRSFEKAQTALSPKDLVLRLAGADDVPALKILAELDEDPEPSGEVLLALIDGEAVAAMSLDDGQVVANPFVATSDAVSLLRLRAGHLAGRAQRKPRPRWRPRFA